MNIAHRIIAEVAEMYHVAIHDLLGYSRAYHIARPRQLLYVRLRDETPLSYEQIGLLIGDRHHTTIMHGEQIARQRIKNGEL